MLTDQTADENIKKMSINIYVPLESCLHKAHLSYELSFTLYFPFWHESHQVISVKYVYKF